MLWRCDKNHHFGCKITLWANNFLSLRFMCKITWTWNINNSWGQYGFFIATYLRTFLANGVRTTQGHLANMAWVVRSGSTTPKSRYCNIISRPLLVSIGQRVSVNVDWSIKWFLWLLFEHPKYPDTSLESILAMFLSLCALRWPLFALPMPRSSRLSSMFIRLSDLTIIAPFDGDQI